MGSLSSRCAQATRKKSPPGQILPQEHIGVLAGGALPGTLRIAEIDPNRSRAGETIQEEEDSEEDYCVASFRGQDLEIEFEQYQDVPSLARIPRDSDLP